MRMLFWTIAPSALVLVPIVLAQTPSTMAHKTFSAAQFGKNPALPVCATMAVQDGDPAAGPAVIAVKTAGRCTIPWHWHTGNERLIILHGSPKLEMKDMPAAMAHEGDFVLMPAKGIHQFSADGPAEFYIVTDAPFDIHYVNSAGTEIPPDQALKTSGGQ